MVLMGLHPWLQCLKAKIVLEQKLGGSYVTVVNNCVSLKIPSLFVLSY